MRWSQTTQSCFQDKEFSWEMSQQSTCPSMFSCLGRVRLFNSPVLQALSTIFKLFLQLLCISRITHTSPMLITTRQQFIWFKLVSFKIFLFSVLIIFLNDIECRNPYTLLVDTDQREYSLMSGGMSSTNHPEKKLKYKKTNLCEGYMCD